MTDHTQNEPRRLWREELAARVTPEALLRNLLAVIHRDGGQYCEAVGIEKATADATAAINEMRGRGESRMPCGHQASAATGNTTRYCGTCALVAEGRKLLREHEEAQATYFPVQKLRAIEEWAVDNLDALLDAAESGGGEPLPAGTGCTLPTGSPVAAHTRADSPGAAPAAPSPSLAEALRALLADNDRLEDIVFSLMNCDCVGEGVTELRNELAALAAHDAGTLALSADGTLPVPDGTLIEVTLRGVYRLAEARSKLRRGILYNHFDEDDIQLGELSGLHPVVRLAAPQPETKPEGGAT